MKKFKKISAAVLATGLLASTSMQVLANETEKVDSSNFETVNLQDALNNVKNELTSIEDLQLIVANIPAGLFTNNIFALSTNIEKINNPQAKLALQKNLEKAVDKYEEKTAEEAIEGKTEEDSVTETPVVVVPETTEKETDVEKSALKIEETESNETKKAEKQVAKDLKKAERDAEKAAKLLEKQESEAAQQAKKEEHKAAQQEKKEERKSAQQLKKEERKVNKGNKKEEKDKK